ncbi:MAG: hypothetical protein IH949_13010, partial [Bacteroidetes bacterium]|nr:hypothetical protein [Bacteroidota bacterium]
GTTGLTGAMDTMMVIKEKNKDYTLHITGRDVAEANYRIVFDKNLFCWNIVDKKEEHKLTAERKEIVELFKKYDRKMRTGEVAQLLGKELSNISGMVRKLVDDDILMSPAYGTYELVEKEESKKPNMTKKDTVDLFNNTQSGQSG